MSSSTLGKSFTIFQADGLQDVTLAKMTLAFPTVDTISSSSGAGTISGTGKSGPMVTIKGDLVELLKGLVGFPFQLIDEQGPPESKLTLDILDVFLGVAINLVQNFDLNFSGLVPKTLSIDGKSVSGLSLGTPLTIQNASSLGPTPFNINLGLAPQTVTLTNDTSLGASMTASITAGVFGYKSLGPITAFKTSFNIPIGTLPPIYSNSFPLSGFVQQTPVTQTV